MNKQTSAVAELGAKELWIVDSGEPRSQEFGEYAFGLGFEVRSLSLNGNPSTHSIKNGRYPQAVVIFSEEEMATESWLKSFRQVTRYLEVPVIVSHGNGTDGARLLKAGASAVYTDDQENSIIVRELKERIKFQTVIVEIEEQVLSHFIAATQMTFREMAGLKLDVNSTYQKRGYRMFGDISAVIGLMSASEGSMVLSFPGQSAAAVAERILPDLGGDLADDLVRDCVGEVANVIVGQAKGILAEGPYQFEMSTPTVVSGAGHEIRHKPGMACLVVAFESELGEFALQICLNV